MNVLRVLRGQHPPGKYLQRWLMIGLSPMHEAMVRRMAREAMEHASKDGLPWLQFQWTSLSELDRWSTWASNDQADVILLASHVLRDPSRSWSTIDLTESIENRDRNCLRLIWSGLDQDRFDLSWCSSWLAAGAIYDARRLASWMRIAVRRGHRVLAPPHPMLQNLSLPKCTNGTDR